MKKKTDNYETIAKKRKRRRKIIKTVVVFCVIIVAVWCFFTYNVNPVLSTIAKEEIKALATNAVNTAVEDSMAETDYTQLVDIETDVDGNITSIQANTIIINGLARDATLRAQNNITKIGEQGIGVPLGALSGINVLAGRGPHVTIKVLPVGSISTSFASDFLSAGINQTKHQLFMDLTASISIVIPGMNNTVTVTTHVLVSEAIIIGKVPDVYLQGDLSNGMLNLIP